MLSLRGRFRAKFTTVLPGDEFTIIFKTLYTREGGGGGSKYVTCVMRDKCKSCASSFVGSPYMFGSTIVLSDVSLNVVKNISVKSETVY